MVTSNGTRISSACYASSFFSRVYIMSVSLFHFTLDLGTLLQLQVNTSQYFLPISQSHLSTVSIWSPPPLKTHLLNPRIFQPSPHMHLPAIHPSLPPPSSPSLPLPSTHPPRSKSQPPPLPHKSLPNPFPHSIPPLPPPPSSPPTLLSSPPSSPTHHLSHLSQAPHIHCIPRQ